VLADKVNPSGTFLVSVLLYRHRLSSTLTDKPQLLPRGWEFHVQVSSK
jgi:hypothetical protein